MIELLLEVCIQDRVRNFTINNLKKQCEIRYCYHIPYGDCFKGETYIKVKKCYESAEERLDKKFKD